MSVTAPYNFVPLSRWVWQPDGYRHVNQDIPFKEGLCGTLKLNLTITGNLFIGSSKNDTFTTTPDNKIWLYRNWC